MPVDRHGSHPSAASGFFFDEIPAHGFGPPRGLYGRRHGGQGAQQQSTMGRASLQRLPSWAYESRGLSPDDLIFMPAHNTSLSFTAALQEKVGVLTGSRDMLFLEYRSPPMTVAVTISDRIRARAAESAMPGQSMQTPRCKAAQRLPDDEASAWACNIAVSSSGPTSYRTAPPARWRRSAQQATDGRSRGAGGHTCRRLLLGSVVLGHSFGWRLPAAS